MNKPNDKQLDALIKALTDDQSGLSTKDQSDLWIKLGIATFTLVMIGGFSLIMSAISHADTASIANSGKIDKLTENVTALVIASENMRTELTQRSGWMEGQNLYSEQSRMKDQEHDQRLKELEDRIIREVEHSSR